MAGYDILFVRNESIVPNINMGDIVITDPVSGMLSSGLEPGRVITYEHDKDRITHHILAIDEDTITTRDDALSNPDPWPVSLSQVKGTAFFHIPCLGYLTGFISTRNGFLTEQSPTQCRQVGRAWTGDRSRANEDGSKK